MPAPPTAAPMMRWGGPEPRSRTHGARQLVLRGARRGVRIGIVFELADLDLLLDRARADADLLLPRLLALGRDHDLVLTGVDRKPRAEQRRIELGAVDGDVEAGRRLVHDEDDVEQLLFELGRLVAREPRLVFVTGLREAPRELEVVVPRARPLLFLLAADRERLQRAALEIEVEALLELGAGGGRVALLEVAPTFVEGGLRVLAVVGLRVSGHGGKRGCQQQGARRDRNSKLHACTLPETNCRPQRALALTESQACRGHPDRASSDPCPRSAAFRACPAPFRAPCRLFCP